MEIRQLEYFAAVVEAGSFTAAAAALHLSQPSLSIAVSQLERQVGTLLLVRGPRGVEPTAAGRFLLEASSRILGDLDEVATTLAGFGAGTTGTLAFASVPVLMWHRVPALLRVHAAHAAGVEVSLVEAPPWMAIDLLAQRQVDAAAVVVAEPRRFAARHRDSLDVVDWGPVPLVAALPPDQQDAVDPFPLREFDGAELLLPRRTAAVPSLPEVVTRAFDRHSVTPSTIRTVETIQAGLPLVQAGLARMIVPDPDRLSLARFDVVVRTLSPQPEPLRALVLTRRGGVVNPLVARLVSLVAEQATRAVG